MPTTNLDSSLIALDVGERRIGVAIANVVARLPRPLDTIINDSKTVESIKKLVERESAGQLVVGLPRGMDGQETEQTRIVRAFAEELARNIQIPIYLQDEALTSRLAEEELQVKFKHYDKTMIDALAAAYILEDFLNEQEREVSNEQ